MTIKKAYWRLPHWLRVAIAYTLSRLFIFPLFLVEGMVRGIVEGWREYEELHNEGMENLRRGKHE